MLRIIGHRGAKDLAPENTIAGLKKAIQHHVDEIEIDVRVTNDGIVVLNHELWLLDMAGNKLDVRKHKHAELLQHKADMPTLEEAILALNKAVPLQIEVKWGEKTAPVVKIVRGFLDKGWKPTDFAFGSKNQRTLMALHKAIPEIPVVVIEPFLSVRAVLRARQLNTKIISMNCTGLWSGFVRNMHRRGYTLYAYDAEGTAEPAKVYEWEKHGLSGIITNTPDKFER